MFILRLKITVKEKKKEEKKKIAKIKNKNMVVHVNLLIVTHRVGGNAMTKTITFAIFSQCKSDGQNRKFRKH